VSDRIDQLPDDPVLLKRLIAESRRAIAERDAVIAEREARIQRLRSEAAEQMEALRLRLEAEKQAAIDAILRRFYGPRSEAFDPTQLLMFGVTVAPETPIDPASDEAAAVEAESGEKLTTRRINRHKHGRRKLPDHLPRRQIVHDLTEEQKKCPCCGEARACIGSETSEQLEYIPAKFEVLQHVRHKYACKNCGEGKRQACDGNAHIDIATKEAQPIEKGLPGPSLVAYVVVSKLGDHLPLYRLETIFDRSGIDIARSTMCSWMLSAGRLVKPLTDLMAQRVRQGKVIHTDETRVPVQDGTTKGKCKSGRIWTYVGDEANPYVVYDYTPDRTRAGPMAWLDKFSGYLQADAYGGYDGIYATGVTEVACWAHARRKFFDAKETDGARAAQMLEFARRLYAVEDEAKAKIAELLKQNPDAPLDERHEIIRALRQEKSQPILAEIKSWLDREKEIVLPRSPMAQAIQYTLNQWAALNRYVERGHLNIDNNAAERALKRVAIGRKNWLFAGNDSAGQSHARLWTLIASAARHGLDPQAYLRSVLAKVGSTPLSELEQFLPDQWKAEDAASVAAPTQSISPPT
jgi:transposase